MLLVFGLVLLLISMLESGIITLLQHLVYFVLIHGADIVVIPLLILDFLKSTALIGVQTELAIGLLRTHLAKHLQRVNVVRLLLIVQKHVIIVLLAKLTNFGLKSAPNHTISLHFTRAILIGCPPTTTTDLRVVVILDYLLHLKSLEAFLIISNITYKATPAAVAVATLVQESEGVLPLGGLLEIGIVDELVEVLLFVDGARVVHVVG